MSFCLFRKKPLNGLGFRLITGSIFIDLEKVLALLKKFNDKIGNWNVWNFGEKTIVRQALP